jgi:SpoIID/LytB domain protein
LAAVSCVVVLGGMLTAAGAAGAENPTASSTIQTSAVRSALRLRPSGSVHVSWRGNGHAHGMSQYGAQGAALRGLTARQILHFYYPHTRLVRTTPSNIRVRLTNISSTYTTVLAAGSGLALTGYGLLPRRGYTMFRLLPSGDGLRLQGLHRGRWRLLTRDLGSRADFHSASHWVQLLDYDGTSTRYHGKIGAVRDGSGELTINRVDMNQYVAGSVAGEVPASWRPAAVHAQAIAARSFAEYLRSLAGHGSHYDICDTTMCQSYVGMAHFDSAGNVISTENVRAVRGNRNMVLRYHGGPVLAQYSASDGGASVSGGLPYLVGKPDPYDSRASGDPYLDQTTSVQVASIASAYGLKKVTAVRVTARDGNGPWGGRVVSAVVVGVNWSGQRSRVHTDGDHLGAAVGVWTDYLRLHDR